MDEYAEEIGVEPRIGDYFFTDFLFFMQLYFGPAYPYMYRLRGPHAWTGARDAILTARERIILPLHQRPVRMREVSGSRACAAHTCAHSGKRQVGRDLHDTSASDTNSIQ
jgi:hypothetical protein